MAADPNDGKFDVVLDENTLTIAINDFDFPVDLMVDVTLYFGDNSVTFPVPKGSVFSLPAAVIDGVAVGDTKFSFDIEC